MLIYTSCAIEATSCSFGQQDIVFRQATVDDLEKLLLFFTDYVSKEPERIVVLPGKFLPKWLFQSVLDGQFFLAEAVRTKEIVGIKRMYLITDALKLENVLWNEIRCLGPEAQQASASFFLLAR